jgi:hypothetical protein
VRRALPRLQAASNQLGYLTVAPDAPDTAALMAAHSECAQPTGGCAVARVASRRPLRRRSFVPGMQTPEPSALLGSGVLLVRPNRDSAALRMRSVPEQCFPRERRR